MFWMTNSVPMNACVRSVPIRRLGMRQINRQPLLLFNHRVKHGFIFSPNVSPLIDQIFDAFNQFVHTGLYTKTIDAFFAEFNHETESGNRTTKHQFRVE